jgi:hypothetical protein
MPSIPERLASLEEWRVSTDRQVSELGLQLSRMPNLTPQQTEALGELISERTVQKARDQLKGQIWKMVIGTITLATLMTGAVTEMVHLLGPSFHP